MRLATGIVLGATLLSTAAANAQGVQLYVGPTALPDRVYVEHNRDWRDSRAQYYQEGRPETVIIKKRRGWDRDREFDDTPRRTIIERY